MKRLPLFLLMILCACSSTQAADLVYRKSAILDPTIKEKRVGGTVISITKTEVTVKPGSGEPIPISTSDVAWIEWDNVPSRMGIARNDEVAGRVDRALEVYQALLADSVEYPEGAKVDLEFYMARTLARQSLVDAAKLPEAIKGLDEFLKKNGDTYHFYETYEWLGQLYLAQEQADLAKGAYDQLASSPFSEDKLASQLGLAKISLAKNDLTSAQAAFEAVANSGGTRATEIARQQEARLGLARCLQLQQKYEPASQILKDLIEAASIDNQKLLAEAYVRRGDCLVAAGNPKEALIAYLHVDLLFAGEKSLHAEALYNLSRLWTELQKPDRAADAAQRLISDYKDSPWAKKLRAEE